MACGIPGVSANHSVLSCIYIPPVSFSFSVESGPSLCRLSPLTGMCWKLFSLGQYEHFGARAMDSVMEICPSILSLFWRFKGAQPPPPPERGAWDWYVQFLEGTLHFWSKGVVGRYGSKTNTKSRLSGLHCVEQLNVTKYVNFSCCNGLAAWKL